MFRDMRRKRQALPEEACMEILNRGTSGVLAVSGDDGYPYAVPLSYVYDGHSIFFHCAASGHKLDSIAVNEKASFCVIGQDLVVPETYTTHYRSVIVFGKIRILPEGSRKMEAIEKLTAKYTPDASPDDRRRAIEKDYAPLCMLEMTIEHMSGKQSIELVSAAPGT